MSAQEPPAPADIDLTTCDREPIHIPGSIQPHGLLLALLPADFTAQMASENAATLSGREMSAILGQPLETVLGEQAGSRLRAPLAALSADTNPVLLPDVTLTVVESGKKVERAFHSLAHRRDGLLVLELEAAGESGAVAFQDIYALVQSFVAGLESVATTAELTHLAAREVQKLTGFDRVMIYRFDPDWNGTVIAESRNEWLPSYLDLRWPASDIPRQARELYRLNRLRLIADARYTPVPIVPTDNPLTGRPLDLSYSTLRSVSPIHIEYMQNMGTPASMSISILRDKKLWGLISCHHHLPRVVSYPLRIACDFLAQMLALQLNAREHSAGYEFQLHLRALTARLLAAMTAQGDFVVGLRSDADALLAQVNAQGAAIINAGQITLVGRTPTQEQAAELTAWLAAEERGEVYGTDCLSDVFPPAGAYQEVGSGLLAVSISQLRRSYVLWFRPETVQTVTWGGDPRKPATPGQERLHPRKSFEQWKETARGRSLPWRAGEVEAAGELRNAVVGIVLRRAEEMATLNAELEHSNQELEHSNKELEAFSYSVSHDLRAPFRHIVGYSEMLRELYADKLDERGHRYVNTIIESAHHAGTLVDNLLSFSQMGRAALNIMRVDMNQLVAEVRQDVMTEAEGRAIIWNIHDLPPVNADVVMLRLALRNLLSNAVKYTRQQLEARIEVGSTIQGGETVFFARDNGAGFDMRYLDKLFGVFQRLHRAEEFEGTGIGLANVRRIVERHGGRVWAEGIVNVGATFYFTLPQSVPS